jgi:anti-sigma factor RsiW
MSHCEECLSRIDLYLDDELREEQLEVINRHIRDCSSCRRELAHRRRFLEQIRAAGPWYLASPELRSRVTELMRAESVGFGADLAPSERAERMVAKGRVRSWFSWVGIGPRPALIACGLMIVGATLLWRLSLREMRATAFVDMAVKAHRQALAGHLPFDIKTSSPEQMGRWFGDKVPFQFRLPTYQEGSAQDVRYQLSGGRLVTFKGEYASYIAYQMKDQLVSLVIISASSAVASGGEKTLSRGLTFHAHRKDDFQVVTWSVHNLTYALVSAVTLPARQSCGVCHASTKDRDLIHDLEHRNPAERSITGGKLVTAAEVQRLAAVVRNTAAVSDDAETIRNRHPFTR